MELEKNKAITDFFNKKTDSVMDLFRNEKDLDLATSALITASIQDLSKGLIYLTKVNNIPLKTIRKKIKQDISKAYLGELNEFNKANEI